MNRITYTILALTIQIGLVCYLNEYNLNILEFLLIFVPISIINYLHGIYVGKEINIKKYFEDDN